MSIQELINEIEAQRSLMILVATGKASIDDVNDEYRARRQRILIGLMERGIEDTNPFTDLWRWYGKWRDEKLSSWASRREYVASIYDPLIDSIRQHQTKVGSDLFGEPTGWERVDRGISGIRRGVETASCEEEFQSIGLRCREILISLAQAVFDPTLHHTIDGVEPSETDAKRMLEAYFIRELAGGSNEEARRHARASLDLANSLQHRRTATFRDAALCAEATLATVNIVAIISGRRNLNREGNAT
jgi:hypothetical protein